MTQLLAQGWIWGALAAALSLLLAYVAAGWLVWLLGGVALLLVFTLTAGASWLVVVVAWLTFAVPFLTFALPPLRRALLTGPLLRSIRDTRVAASAADKVAIDAGTVGWEAELFSGRPRWRRLLKIPPCRLSDEERAFLDGSVRWLCAVLDEHEINDRLHDLPEPVWRLLRDKGFFALRVPVEFGGRGFSAAAVSAIVTRLASRSMTAALTVLAPNGLGPALLVDRCGSTEQKAEWLTRLASPGEIGAYASTSLHAGSDAHATTDRGVASAQIEGQAGPGVVLDFDKRFILLAPVATVFAVVFRLDDPEGVLGEASASRLAVALVPADAAGVRRGQRYNSNATAIQVGTVSGNAVAVPATAILGLQSDIWSTLREGSAETRTLFVPALAAAAAKVAARCSGAHARIRYQYEHYIGRFEGVQEALARIAGNTYAIDAARHAALAAIDDGQRPAVVSALLKFELGARSSRVLDDAMAVFAGAGVFLGPHNLVGELRRYQDVLRGLDGSDLHARSRQAFRTGVMRCHPHLRAEMSAAADPDRQRGELAFDRAMARHMAFFVSNALRALLRGMSAARLVPVPLGQSRVLRRYMRQVSRMSAAFALSTDVLLLFSRDVLTERQRIAGRMADILAQLHIAAAIAKHFYDQGREEADEPLARWAMEDCLLRAGQAFERLFENFPVPVLGRVLRRMTFPYGRLYRAPGDALDARVARILLVPCSARDRLTSGIYLPLEEDGQLARLENALTLVVRTAPAVRKLRAAAEINLVTGTTVLERLERGLEAGVLSEDEAQALRAAEEARARALTVATMEEDDAPAQPR